MTDKRRTWISALIGLAAVALIVWLSPSPNYQAHGILLPAKTSRAPISPMLVTQMQKVPPGAVILGHINIERHYPAEKNLAQQQIGELAQKLAAEVGANRIFVNNFRLGAVTRTRYIYVFQATVFYTPEQQSLLEQ